MTNEKAGHAGVALALLMAAALAGCSSSGTFSTSRFTSLFGSGGGSSTDAPAAGGPPIDEVDCPTVEIRPGAASMAANLPPRPGSDPDVNSLRYQLSFGETARECRVNAGSMTVKVGVQGRVVLGAAGAPGQVSIPLRYAVVREGPEPKTIVSKFHQASANVPPGQLNTPFTVIVDDLVFPIPSPSELEAYVIYVGFDPQGARAAPKGTPKAAPKRQRQ